jgi:predicted amidophosphoribosyltransferase
MFCLACTGPSASGVCPACSAQLRVAPEAVAGRLLVVAAFTHDGPARRLVHALKYRGVTAAALPFATALADRVPDSVTALVPVPRAIGRSIRYGVDPAAVLATGVSDVTGVPVIRALSAPVWWRRHAGASRGHRARIRFRLRLPVPPGAALVDDVVTTGATVAAAAEALEGLPTLVFAATVAPMIKEGNSPVEVA